MTITCGTLNTGSELHGTIKPTAWSFSRSIQTYFGVTGAYRIHGRLHERELTCWLHPTGYATHALLQAAIESVNGAIGTSGTMTWTVGADSKTFTLCTFEGLELDEDPWLDGSGVNGWQAKGTLRFRQIKS